MLGLMVGGSVMRLLEDNLPGVICVGGVGVLLGGSPGGPTLLQDMHTVLSASHVYFRVEHFYRSGVLQQPLHWYEDVRLF